MPTCARCGGTSFAEGVCISCSRGARPVTGTVLRRPPPPAPPGLILRELTDDDADLPQAIVLRELPPEPAIVLRELPRERAPGSSSDGAGLILRELPPDEPVPGIILGEIIEADRMEGFEATGLDEVALRPKPPPPPPPPRRAPPGLEAFRTEVCPSCGVGQSDPYAAFCEACSSRLPRVRRAPAAAGADTRIKCRRCGLANDRERAACTNCGQRLVS